MTLKKLLTGSLTKTQFAWIIIPGAYAMITCWLISRVLYAAGGQRYFWDRNAISEQGNLVTNPIGCWFFVIGTALASFNILILLTFVFRRFGKRHRSLSALFLLCGVVGAFGLFLVGIAPVGGGRAIELIHGIGSIMAFAGLGSGLALSFVIGLIRLAMKQPWPTPIQFFSVLGLVVHIGIMAFFSESGSLIQWTAFNAIVVWLVGLFMIAPEQPCGDKG